MTQVAFEQCAVEQRGPDVFRDDDRRGQQHRGPAAAAHGKLPQADQHGEEEEGDGHALHSEAAFFIVALERRGDLRCIAGKLGAVDVARARQGNVEDLRDASRRRRHEHDAIAEAHRLAHVVRDEDDGLAAFHPDVLDVAVELLAGERIERGEGLVHQQHPRVGRERAGQRDALLHAAGELVHMRMLELLEADELEEMVGDFLALGIPQIRPQFQPEHHVAEDVEPRKQRRFLEHDEPLPPGPFHELAVGEHAAGIRHGQACDDVEQGRFAAAARPDADRRIRPRRWQGRRCPGRGRASATG